MSDEEEKLFDDLVMDPAKLELGLRAMALSGVAAERYASSLVLLYQCLIAIATATLQWNTLGLSWTL